MDQTLGYSKAGEALRSGGTLALFWNRPRIVPSALLSQIDKLYLRLAPGLEDLTPQTLIGVEKFISECITATELFEVSKKAGFPWSNRLETGPFIALLETYSAHASLPDSQRRELLAGVAELVDAAGGAIDVHYETVVHLAKRS